MDHYVCPGSCRGSAEIAGACQVETYSRYGQPMTQCHCTDGEHSEVLDNSPSA